MSTTSTPNKSVASRVSRLLELAIDVSGDKFTCFLDYKAHISVAGMRIHTDGWSSGDDWIEIDICLSGDRNEGEIVTSIDQAISKILDLKRKSDERWSPENIEKTKSRRDAKRLADARKVIKELEGQK